MGTRRFLSARPHEGSHERPLIFPFGADVQASYIAELTTVGTEEAVTLYVERLVTLPAYVADFIDTLKAGKSAGYRRPSDFGLTRHSFLDLERVGITLWRWLCDSRCHVAHSSFTPSGRDRAGADLIYT